MVEDKGVRILVDPKAVLFLLGTEMDYKVDKLSAQFVFNNPNQTCGLRLRRIGAARARRSSRPVAPRRTKTSSSATPAEAGIRQNL